MRAACAVGLLLVPPFSVGFFVLYLAAGASDMVDGPLARYLHSESRFGATFDGIADLVFPLLYLPVGVEVTAMSIGIALSVFDRRSAMIRLFTLPLLEM